MQSTLPGVGVGVREGVRVEVGVLVGVRVDVAACAGPGHQRKPHQHTHSSHCVCARLVARWAVSPVTDKGKVLTTTHRSQRGAGQQQWLPAGRWEWVLASWKVQDRRGLLGPFWFQ